MNAAQQVDGFGRVLHRDPISAEIETLLGEMASAYNRAVRRDQPVANPRLRMAYASAIEIAKTKTAATIAKLKDQIAVFESYSLAGDADLRNASLNGTIDVRHVLRRGPDIVGSAQPTTVGTPDAKTIIVGLLRRCIKLRLDDQDNIIAIQSHGSGAIVELHENDWVNIRSRERDIRRVLDRERVY